MGTQLIYLPMSINVKGVMTFSINLIVWAVGSAIRGNEMTTIQLNFDSRIAAFMRRLTCATLFVCKHEFGICFILPEFPIFGSISIWSLESLIVCVCFCDVMDEAFT